MSRYRPALVLLVGLVGTGFVHAKQKIDVLSIPQTVVRPAVGGPADVIAIAPRAERYVIPLREIGQNQIAGVDTVIAVNSTWIRVESKHGVNVWFDDEQVFEVTPSYKFREGAGGDGWETASNLGAAHSTMEPAVTFVYEGPVKVVRLGLPTQGIAYSQREILSHCTLFVGRGGVRDVDRGIPGSVGHALVDGGFGTPAFRFTDPFFPTIQGPLDNDQSTDFSFKIPYEWELASLGVFVSWAGATGILMNIFFGHYDEIGTFQSMRAWHPNTERFFTEMTDPPLFDGLGIRKTFPLLPLTGGLGVFVQASLAFSSIGVDMAWKYWM